MPHDPEHVSLEDWRDKTIEPVFDPLFFEDPVIRTELRPIFIWHNINDEFITNGGNVQVYALQLRVKLTDQGVRLVRRWGRLVATATVNARDGAGLRRVIESHIALAPAG